MPIVTKGLEGIAVAQTRIGDVRGDVGQLIYYGYDINELAGNVCFEEVIHLLGPNTTAAIEREVPGDAHQPYAKIANGGQLAAVLDDADEGVLHNVFGLGPVRQHAPSHGEKLGAVAGNQPRRRITVAPPGFCDILGIGVMHVCSSVFERSKPRRSGGVDWLPPSVFPRQWLRHAGEESRDQDAPPLCGACTLRSS